MNSVFEIVSQMNNYEELLVDYNMFFNELNKGFSFVIDENNELQELHRIISYIKSIDTNVTTFCHTYGVNNKDDKKNIYSDNLWICTSITVNEMQKIFSKYDTKNNPLRAVVPCFITILSDEENVDNNIEYIINKDGILKNYKEEKKNIEFTKTISLYWD